MIVKSLINTSIIIDSAKTILEGAGFKLLSENSKWTLERGGKYFFTRNQSTIVAFAVGPKFVCLCLLFSLIIIIIRCYY